MLRSELKAHTNDDIHVRHSNYLQYQNGSCRLKLYTTQGDWVLEENGESRILKHGDELQPLHGGNWKYVSNESPHAFSALKLVFEVSPDYEYVSVELLGAAERIQISAQVMNYPLYLLAKKMREDMKEGIYSDNEKGWVYIRSLLDTLRKELCNPAIDQYYLNVQIYRLRKTFEKTPYRKVLNGLIERRYGQIRFNHQNFIIKEYEKLA